MFQHSTVIDGLCLKTQDSSRDNSISMLHLINILFVDYKYKLQKVIPVRHVCSMYVWLSHMRMDQPGKVANSARGQLNRENEHSLVPVRA